MYEWRRKISVQVFMPGETFKSCKWFVYKFTSWISFVDCKTWLLIWLMMASSWVLLFVASQSDPFFRSWYNIFTSTSPLPSLFEYWVGNVNNCKIVLSLSLNLRYGQLTSCFPVSSWLYMRTLCILFSFILITWPAHQSCSCIRKVLIPPVLHLMNRSALEILFSMVYP